MFTSLTFALPYSCNERLIDFRRQRRRFRTVKLFLRVGDPLVYY